MNPRPALRRAAAVVRKDLVSEGRTRSAFNAMAFLGMLTILVFGFAVGPDAPTAGPARIPILEYVSPGLLWIAILLTGVLALGRSFHLELEGGGLESFRLYPGGLSALWWGKVAGNTVVLLAMEALLVAVTAILYSLDLWTRLGMLAAVALPATVGLATVGTFFAALTVNIRAREVLLPLLLFPIAVPVLLAAVNASALVLRGDPMRELQLWIRLLVVFDVVFLTVCTLGFDYVLDD